MSHISNTRLGGLAAGVKRAGLSPENRKLVITLAGVLALVFIFVSSNVAANHDPKPHDLPVGVVGPPQLVSATARQLDRRAPGAFQILGYGSPAAARTAILHRSVYGAFDPGPPPSLTVADAASLPVATLLQDTFTAAARARGAPLIVHDLVPLPPTDPNGGTAFSATLSLIIAGVLGSSLLYVATQRRGLAVHLSAVIALGIGAGLLTAVATDTVIGAFAGQFLAIWGVAALFVLALALPIAFFQRLLGLPGTGVGLLVFIVVGDPSSGGATAPQLLPDPWRAISQALPPGAAVTAMRDVVYFHGYGATRALIVLSSYAALGAILAIITDRIRTGTPAATSVASTADNPDQVSAQPPQGVAPDPPAPRVGEAPSGHYFACPPSWHVPPVLVVLLLQSRSRPGPGMHAQRSISGSDGSQGNVNRRPCRCVTYAKSGPSALHVTGHRMSAASRRKCIMGGVRNGGELRGRMLRLARFPAVLALLASAGVVVAPTAAAAAPAVTATIPVGHFPLGMAVNAVTGTVYVVNVDDDTMSVISGRTDTVTATIPVGSPLGLVAVNSVTGTVYVVNDNGSVLVISGRTDRVIATVPLGLAAGYFPRGVAVNSLTGTVYVTSAGAGLVGRLSVISGWTNRVIATVPVGPVDSVPGAMAVNSLTGTIYAVNGGGPGSVLVISGWTDKVIATITTGGFPGEVAVNPVTGTVYVTNLGGIAAAGTVSVISGRTDKVIATITTGGPLDAGAGPVAVNPVTGTVYVAAYDGLTLASLVTVISGRTDTVTATIPVAPVALAVAVNPVTGTVYVLSAGTDISFPVQNVTGTVSVIAGPRFP